MLVIVFVLSLLIISCRIPGLDKAQTMLTELPAIVTEVAQEIPDIETLLPEDVEDLISTPIPLKPPAMEPSGDIIHLWAAVATASSEYGSTNWSANMALGKPDTFECGDQMTAWASQESNTEEWLELGYAVPLYVTEIVIHQSFNPTQITKVELIEPNGSHHEVYSSDPTDKRTNCPYQTIISWENPLNYPVESVRITIDQSVLGMGWAEIDAVQLSGIQVENLYAEDSSNKDQMDDDLPIPPGATIMIQTSDTVSYEISMPPGDLMDFYHQEFKAMGLKENELLTVLFDGGFSMVFEGSDKGDTIVQASDMGNGKVIVVLRHE